MSNVLPSPNMNMPIPAVGLEPGPQYAADENTCFTIIDGHNHSPGSGVQVTPDGININSSLPFQNFPATSIRYIGYTAQASKPPGTLLSYTDSTDLWYVDGAGNNIQLTKSGAPNSGTGNISGLPSTPTGGAGVAWQNSASTFQFTADNGTSGANIDAGTFVLRYPGSYPSPSGNYISIQAPSALSGGYSITLPTTAAGGAGALLTSDTSGNISYSYPDGSTLVYNGQFLEVNPGGIGTSQLADGAVTPAKRSTAVYAASASSGTFNTAATSFITVPGVQCVVTSTGRPLVVTLGPDGSNEMALYAQAGTGHAEITLGTATFSIPLQDTIFNTGFSGTIAEPTPGSYTAQVRLKAQSGATCYIQNAVLVLYEL